MGINRGTLLLVLLVTSALWAWQSLTHATGEIAVLRTTGTGHVEHYASVWYVRANNALWIRAENRGRSWLAEIHANPRVELALDGQTRGYIAHPMDMPKYQNFIDAEFRKKYGFSDWVRSLKGDRNTLPIQLKPI
ncbi:MAG: nitroreductase family deazaflavin-dependent oxidoreductase [Deltaproteobacteria bacterium]|jgi:hypothetical protein|nr:nitroreductase family deazaflavin-dependent oxidoreductase [Deltaproteobacteria bacterium]MBW2543146.1 nitroreductase family deazaflavin-dependent oxidoreductase [Deltaproteobacteria bacterium]